MNYIILGPPGSGKGTQCQIISQQLKNVTHIITGDLLRKEIENNTDIGKKIKTLMDSGNLVPDEIVFSLVKKSIDNYSQKGNIILLDGYPRTKKQAELLFNNDNANHYSVIKFDVDEDVLLARITNRMICKECKTVYNKKFNPPPNNKCFKCGSKEFIVRTDDSKETFKKRILIYKEQESGVVDFLNKSGVELHIIGASKSTKNITEKILKIIRMQEVKWHV